MEEQAQYGKARVRDYSDLANHQTPTKAPKSDTEDYMNDIMYTLTRVNRMIGSLLPVVDEEIRGEYLQAEQTYRDIVFSLLDIIDEKVGK